MYGLATLAGFVIAMHGPGVGCELSQSSYEWCIQEPNQPAPICERTDHGPYWRCNGFDPHHLAWDLDGDFDVDLADFAMWQRGFGGNGRR